jgi:hypothetical protein
MKVDAQLQFSDDQALTATANSTNIVDLGADNNIGIGQAMGVLIIVKVAADNTTTNETYTVTVTTDDNAAFSSETTLVAATTLAAGSAIGTRIIIPIAPNATAERYLRLTYTLGGTTPTVTLDAWLTPIDLIPHQQYFARGYVVR